MRNVYNLMDSCNSFRIININNVTQEHQQNKAEPSKHSIILYIYFIQEMSWPISSVTDYFMTNSDKNCEWK